MPCTPQSYETPRATARGNHNRHSQLGFLCISKSSDQAFLLRATLRSSKLLASFLQGFRLRSRAIVNSRSDIMAGSGNTAYTRTIRRQQLKEMVPLADSTIFGMEQRGEFPRRFALSPRCVVWDLSEVEAWLASRRTRPIERGQQVDVHYRRTRPVKGSDRVQA